MNFHSPEEREAWVRFASAAATEPEVTSLEAAGFADLLLAEFRKRVAEDTFQFINNQRTVHPLPHPQRFADLAQRLHCFLLASIGGTHSEFEANQLLAELEGERD